MRSHTGYHSHAKFHRNQMGGRSADYHSQRVRLELEAQEELTSSQVDEILEDGGDPHTAARLRRSVSDKAAAIRPRVAVR